MKNKQTLKEAGYEYVRYSVKLQSHILRDITTGKLELWDANKNHASYGIVYKNTHLEFRAGYDSFYASCEGDD